MAKSDFNLLLKAVSRSFYLSIRILPNAMQAPVAIAYLLARAADAIADTATITETSRLEYLLHFRDLVTGSEETHLQSLNPLIETIGHPGERELLFQLQGILLAYSQLSTADYEAVKKVVTTLTMGMEKDLRYFISDDGIKALPDSQSLDDYTYYVAGCVGEFWTELSILHTPSLNHWQKEKMSSLGIQFGKALQLTNILRDIAKDAELNRCYLPASDLKEHSLDTNMLAEKNNNALFKPVIDKWVSQADVHFESAETYLLSIPRTCLRLRLAALWPILIGLKTLSLIKENGNFLDKDINVKVKRKWVYKMLLLSVPASFSNTILTYWLNSLKSN